MVQLGNGQRTIVDVLLLYGGLLQLPWLDILALFIGLLLERLCLSVDVK